jgi:hypothetical protein
MGKTITRRNKGKNISVEEKGVNAYDLRNRNIVDHASRLICCCDGKKGGTDQTVKYAGEQGLTIVNVLRPQAGNVNPKS